MCRNILDIKSNKEYQGNAIGRLLEDWFRIHNLPSKRYEHGNINELLKKNGVKPVRVSDGGREYYLGRDIIPVIKAEIERVRNKASKPKKTAPKQMTIEEVAEELDTDAAFLELLYHLCGKDALEWYFRKRLKEIYG